jgi:hypothetical protein
VDEVVVYYPKKVVIIKQVDEVVEDYSKKAVVVIVM